MSHSYYSIPVINKPRGRKQLFPYSRKLTGDFAVLENELARIRAAHAELVELWRRAEALGAPFDDEGGDAVLLLRGARVRPRVHDQHVGVRAARDPELAAVQEVVVALLLGLQLHRHHVGAGVGLGHRQSTHVLAAAQLRF